MIVHFFGERRFSKSKGLSASVSFLPLSLLSFFGSRFIFRAVKTENLVPLSFFAPKLNGNASYAGYATLLTKGANPLPHAGSLTKIVTFFFRKLKISRVGPAGSPKTSPRAWKIACKYHHGERRKIKWINTQHPLHCKLWQKLPTKSLF